MESFQIILTSHFVHAAPTRSRALLFQAIFHSCPISAGRSLSVTARLRLAICHCFSTVLRGIILRPNAMTEIMNCLPEGARKHFINLRNVRLEAETARYNARLIELRAQIAARSQGRSGRQEMEEWKYKEELSNSLATGCVQDALETCQQCPCCCWSPAVGELGQSSPS